MKKLFILLTAAAIVAAVSCKKEIVPDVIEEPSPEQEETQTLKNPITITFTAEALTKVSLSDDSTGEKKTAVWDTGDQIKIVWWDGTQAKTKLSAALTEEQAGSSSVTFTVDVDEADYYYAVYPSSLEVSMTDENSLSVSFENDAACPTSFSDAAYYAAKTTKAAKTFAFHPISTIIKFQVDDSKAEQVYFSSMGESLTYLTGGVPITFDAYNVPVLPATKDGSITDAQDNVTVSVGGEGIYYLPLPASKETAESAENGNGFILKIKKTGANVPAAYWSSSIQLKPGTMYKLKQSIDDRTISDYYVSPDGDGTGLTQESPASMATMEANVPAFKYNTTASAMMRDGATIHLLGGNYTSPIILKSSDAARTINIVGKADGNETTFSPTAASTFGNAGVTANVSNITFTGISGGYSAMWVTNGKVNLTGVIFSGNTKTSNESGAAILVQNASTITLENCEFTNNTASSYGGAIGASGTATIKMRDCVFSGNKTDGAKSTGGAIYLNGTSSESPSLEAVDCKFISNSCKGNSGGAIFLNNQATGHIYLTGCTFYNNNTGGNFGGAIHCANQVAENTSFLGINNSLFFDNYGTKTLTITDGSASITASIPHAILNSTFINTDTHKCGSVIRCGANANNGRANGSWILNNVISNESSEPTKAHYSLNTVNENYWLRSLGYNVYSETYSQVTIADSDNQITVPTLGASASLANYTWDPTTYAWAWDASSKTAKMASKTTLEGLLTDEKPAAFLTWLESISYNAGKDNAFTVDINGTQRNESYYWPGCYQNDGAN